MAFRVCVLTSKGLCYKWHKILNGIKWILVVDILNLLTLLTSIAFLNFAKSINLWWMVSFWCELLCKLSIYTLKIFVNTRTHVGISCEKKNRVADPCCSPPPHPFTLSQNLKLWTHTPINKNTNRFMTTLSVTSCQLSHVVCVENSITCQCKITNLISHSISS